MSSALLKDHRCSCGKLLLKGFLFHCLVEIKCRRCGNITVLGSADTVPCAVVESDPRAKVTYVYGDTLTVLGYERDQILGKRIHDVFPMIRDKAVDVSLAHTAGTRYEIADNKLLFREGRPLSVDSCIIPRFRDGTFDGYRILSVPYMAGTKDGETLRNRESQNSFPLAQSHHLVSKEYPHIVKQVSHHRSWER